VRPAAVLAFVLVNIALRIWVFRAENGDIPLGALSNPDEANYLTYGRELLSQGPSWFFHERALSAPPGHALYLALTGGSVIAAKVMSILLSSLTLVPVITMARHLSSARAGTRVPFVAAVAFTLAIPLLQTAPTLLTEPPNTFFVTAALAAAMTAGNADSSQRRQFVRWLVAGTLLGVGTLFRMSTLMMPVALLGFAGLAWVWPAIRRQLAFDLPKVTKGLALFTAGTFLVVAPFIVKNGVLFRQWNLGMGSGALLYLGADPKTDGHEPFFSQYNFDTREVTGALSHVQPEGDRLLAQAAKRQIAMHPLSVLARRVKWPLRLFVGQPADAFNPARSLEQSWHVFGFRATAFALWNLLWRAVIVFVGSALFVRRWRTVGGFVGAGSLLYYFVALLPVFVVPRYSIPVLPLLTAATAAWFDDRKMTSASSLVLTGLASTVAIAVAGWRSVFPPHTDPSDYNEHTVLATFPGTRQTWHPVAQDINVVVGPESQTVLCGPDEITLEAKAPLLALENNQIVLLPLRARPAAGQVTVQLFWDEEGQPAFTEAQSAHAVAYAGGWADLAFRIPAHANATLARMRLDTGDTPGLSVQLRPARVTSPGLIALGIGDLATRTASWSCRHDCDATPDGAFRTQGADPYFGASVPPITMDYDLDVSVGLAVSGVAPPTEEPRHSEVFGKLQWRRVDDTSWLAANRVDFSLSAPADWEWLRMNPSFLDGIRRWTGDLEAVRLVLRCTSYRVLDIGTMKLVKDYRMLGGH
jgi:hypothetical protein